MSAPIAAPTAATSPEAAVATTDPVDEHPRDAASKARRRARYLAGLPGHLVRTYPATLFLVLAPIIVGLASGSGWRSVEETSWFSDIAYGTPALVDGKYWTFITGMFFVQGLVWVYLPILALLAVVGGVYERRAGHLRLLLVVVVGQAAATFISAWFFYALRDSDWPWAVQLSAVSDVGISAGLFVLFGAFTASMQPVWRTRARYGLSTFLIAMVLTSGNVWDVSHTVGWILGLLLGPMLLGRSPGLPNIDFGRRTQRSLVSLIVALLAISTMIQAVYPGTGGPFVDPDTPVNTGFDLAVLLTSLVLFAAADGLRRGHRVAWVFMTGLILLVNLAVLTEESGVGKWADILIYGGQLILLLVTFRAFGVRSRRRSVRRAGRRLLKVALFLFVYTAAGFLILQDNFTPTATITDMVAEFATRLFFETTHNIEPTTTAARWFVGSIGAVWLGALIITLIGLIYSARRVLPEDEQDERMRDLLRRCGSGSIGWMNTWKGTTVWFSSSGNTAIGYRVVGTVALALGDPIGPVDERLTVLQEFDDFCFAHGWLPCFFAADTTTRDLAPQVRWKAIQVAEDDIVPLPDLAFKGKSWQDVRTALNKAGKQDITLKVTTWAESRPVVQDQLYAISNGWVSDKSLPEMGFTLGTLREADDPEVRLHLAVDADGTIEGFTSWMPVARDGQVVGWCLDLMRRRDDGFRSVMEFLIGASAMQFKEEGFEFMSLSAAPLAKAPGETEGQGDQVVLQRLLDFLGDALEPYYGFRSLLAFKSKFQPTLSPMYLVFPDEVALAEIGIAIARAYMPDAGAWDWAKMGVEMVTTPSS